MAEEYISSNLSSFDSMYQNQYIHNIVGDEPKHISKWNPLNHTKKRKKEFQIIIEDYEKKSC